MRQPIYFVVLFDTLDTEKGSQWKHRFDLKTTAYEFVQANLDSGRYARADVYKYTDDFPIFLDTYTQSSFEEDYWQTKELHTIGSEDDEDEPTILN